MSEEGYKLDPSSIKPVLALKDSPPKTVKVRKLMGFLNYYHGYVKNFSRIAKSIYDLVKMASQPPQEAQQVRTKEGCSTNGQLLARSPVDWTDIHQSALETSTDLITSAPVIAHRDFQKPFIFILMPHRTG